ncbi:MAG: rRNA maturation RNase YbeY [Bacteroidales bacterium]|nr:rRNA maturation RNase YbeY [Bacteroidales bacterium]
MLHFIDNDVRSRLKGKTEIKKWINSLLSDRNYSLGEVNVIFCSDPYILELNKSTLGHNYFTDIITFDYCQGNVVSGDLYISLDTVLANSRTYRQMFSPALKCELLRVIIHGILHLAGEDDVTPYKQKKMRQAENAALKLLVSGFDIGKIDVGYKG